MVKNHWLIFRFEVILLRKNNKSSIINSFSFLYFCIQKNTKRITYPSLW